MRTIHKYPLDEKPVTKITTHRGARWLTAQMQADQPPHPDRMTVWAEVDTNEPEVQARLHAVGTGQRVPPGARHYIGTLQRGIFVFHIYAEGE